MVDVAPEAMTDLLDEIQVHLEKTLLIAGLDPDDSQPAMAAEAARHAIAMSYWLQRCQMPLNRQPHVAAA